MKLLTLDLEKIGPFSEAHLDFRERPGDTDTDAAPIVLITGENGTGKSIIIDAIREAFGVHFIESHLPRSIFRDNETGQIVLGIFDGQIPMVADLEGKGVSHRSYRSLVPNPWKTSWNNVPLGVGTIEPPIRWIVDYWQSALQTGGYEIASLSSPRHEFFLMGSLLGEHKNADTTAFICHIDYLRDSQDPRERGYGELLFHAMKDIARVSLLDGRFAHVARSRLEPMFEQRGQLIGISKLSAGSQYLMQRMLGLLSRMYSCRVVAERDGKAGDDETSLLETPGLLLIDEAENHLHPKWQRRLLPTVRRLFPNLQIVVATHSPFILASAPGAKVFVCRAEGEQCTVTDVSDSYANKPIDDILMSPAFAETRPFSQEISDLLDRRRQAIEDGDEQARADIEAQLLERNPEYFDYLEINTMLERMRDGAGTP